MGREVVDSFVTAEAAPFAPYVDLTLPEGAHFEDPLENAALETTLAFVVADAEEGCTHSWGTYYSIDAAGRALDLDRRIERYRGRGGEITVSFGGQANDELAVACDDPALLEEAYGTASCSSPRRRGGGSA